MVEFLLFFLFISSLLSGFVLFKNLEFFPRKIVSLAQQKEAVSLSIIIPVRNEENSLPKLLDSIQDQTVQPLEILIVDDHSSDGTRNIAERYGATVISLNENEKGKSAGCWSGAEEARGEWLLFMDADTYFASSKGLESSLSYYQSLHTSGMLSIQPYHETKRHMEQFSFTCNLIVMAGINHFFWGRERFSYNQGAFGPFILVKNKIYKKTGGHRKIIESHMDDIELARLYQKEGLPIFVYPGKGVLSFRMYPDGLRSLIHGWTKSLAAGSLDTHAIVQANIFYWVAGSLLTFFTLLYSVFSGNEQLLVLSILGYGFHSIFLNHTVKKIGYFRWWTSLIYPVFHITFIGLYGYSFIQYHFFKKVHWKDREVYLSKQKGKN